MIVLTLGATLTNVCPPFGSGLAPITVSVGSCAKISCTSANCGLAFDINRSKKLSVKGPTLAFAVARSAGKPYPIQERTRAGVEDQIFEKNQFVVTALFTALLRCDQSLNVAASLIVCNNSNWKTSTQKKQIHQ